MSRTPAGELILTDAMLAVCWPNAGTPVPQTRGFCPYHEGSTGSDLMIDPVYGRFSCIVCGRCGWTEDGWKRWQAGGGVVRHSGDLG